MTDKRIRDLPALAGVPDPATLVPVSEPNGLGGYATKSATVAQIRGDAGAVPFDPAGTGLTATDVQAALIELDGRAAGASFRQITQTFATGEERLIPLPLAADLARPVPEVLKFIAAVNDQTVEVLSFNAGEESAFEAGTLVDFNGVAKPRTTHSLAVATDASWTGGGTAVISDVVVSSRFKSFGG